MTRLIARKVPPMRVDRPSSHHATLFGFALPGMHAASTRHNKSPFSHSSFAPSPVLILYQHHHHQYHCVVVFIFVPISTPPPGMLNC